MKTKRAAHLLIHLKGALDAASPVVAGGNHQLPLWLARLHLCRRLKVARRQLVALVVDVLRAQQREHVQARHLLVRLRASQWIKPHGALLSKQSLSQM